MAEYKTFSALASGWEKRFVPDKVVEYSLPKIGKEFGNRDHTTVMHAYNKIKSLLLDDDNLEIEITAIKNKIR